jgi:hypothetical protein
MESGLYITFFNKDEPRDRELPPVGPLDRVVLRHRQLLAERASVQQAQELGVSIDRWLEAELELQRATGEEPGGTKRPEMRLAARDGVFLRFAVFGEAHEREPIPELGPFAVVVVGSRGIEGDGKQLASRADSELAQWELTSGAGDDFAGLHKPDIAFRTASGAYHAEVAPAPAPRVMPTEPRFAQAPPRIAPAFTPPPRIEPAFTPPPRIEPTLVPPPRNEPVFRPPTEPEPLFKPREEKRVSTPPPAPRLTPPVEEPPALTARDLELIQRIERERAEETLRARIQGEERHRLGVDETSEDDVASTWAMRYRPQAANAEGAEEYTGTGGGASGLGGLLWQMRFAIIGVLLIGAGAYGFIAIRTGTAPSVAGVQQYSFVGVGSKVSGTRWDWVVNGVQRVTEAGTLRAQGIYYIVRVGATNKGTEGAQIAPNDFTLIDANGIEHAASGIGSGVYQGSGNPGSPNIWPQSFPIGKTATFNVVFEVDPSLPRGMVFGIADLPRTRVRLD